MGKDSYDIDAEKALSPPTESSCAGVEPSAHPAPQQLHRQLQNRHVAMISMLVTKRVDAGSKNQNKLKLAI
jgi:amino acid permease